MIKVIENFITEDEEKDILSHIRPSKVKLGEGRNRIVRYGSKLPYNAPTRGDIPEWLHDICFRVLRAARDNSTTLDTKPDSVTINEYHKGQSIDWHIDSPTSGPVISVLSLLSDSKMGLKPEKEPADIDMYVLPRRSLLILSEDERWKWKHCIYPVEENRFSIVFRKGINVSLPNESTTFV